MCNTGTQSPPTTSFNMMPKSMSDTCVVSSIQCLPKMPHCQRSVTTEDCRAAAAPTLPSRRGSLFMELPRMDVSPPRYPTRRASIVKNAVSSAGVDKEKEEDKFDPPIQIIYVPTALGSKYLMDHHQLPIAKKNTTMLSPSQGFFKSLARPPKLPCRQRTFDKKLPAA